MESLISSVLFPTAPSPEQGDPFRWFAESVARQIGTNKHPPFFTTSSPVSLFDVYLSGFPDGPERQHHNCHTCRRFIETYGGLVWVDSNGITLSAAWSEDDVPEMFRLTTHMLRTHVQSIPIDGVFLSSQVFWGGASNFDKKRNHVWNHLQAQNPSVFKHPLVTAHQAMAVKTQDLQVLERSLCDFTRNTVLVAKRLLETDQLYCSEKLLGVATWFLDLIDSLSGTRPAFRQNLMWKAVATAPVGFTHIRSSMIGTLLEDIQSGSEFEDVARRFAEKMHPLKYQRAQVLPTEGNRAEAERIIETLQTAGSLARRFARLDDLQTIWRPTRFDGVQVHLGPVFGHVPIASKHAPPTQTVGGTITMTWAKFRDTTLPVCERIECLVPAVANFAALVTAQNPDSPPMLQWDFEDARNPVSWYLYHGGSMASDWNLAPNAWVPVDGFCLSPNMWNHNRQVPHQSEAVHVLLQNAYDKRRESVPCGGGLFTESLRSEYHSIRRTLEAYFLRAPIARIDGPGACGIRLQKTAPWGLRLRATTHGLTQEFTLDRWD